MFELRHPIDVNLILCGPYGVGLTSLIKALVHRDHDNTRNHIPTYGGCITWQGYSRDLTVNDEQERVDMTLQEVMGGEDHERWRSLVFTASCQSWRPCAVILVYNVNNRFSLGRVKDFMKEVREFMPDTPVVLCGNQRDRRGEIADGPPADGTRPKYVSWEEGVDLARELGCASFAETSAVTLEGVDDLFDEAALAALRNSRSPPPRREPRCVLQ